MAKKTNKTSHVLNLLTNGASSEASKNNASSRTAIPKKVTVVNEGSRNDKLSQEILSSLSEGLEYPPRQEDVGTSSVGQDVLPAEDSIEIPDIQLEDTVPAQDAVQTDKEEEELQELMDNDADEYHFVNVMEELLGQQDLNAILKQYDVCTCPRCNADVRALTLTALPSKYVVIGTHSFSPVLNYYENKYKIDMLTALSKACSTVRMRPHHKR